jgi:hypothetical protein
MPATNAAHVPAFFDRIHAKHTAHHAKSRREHMASAPAVSYTESLSYARTLQAAADTCGNEQLIDCVLDVWTHSLHALSLTTAVHHLLTHLDDAIASHRLVRHHTSAQTRRRRRCADHPLTLICTQTLLAGPAAHALPAGQSAAGGRLGWPARTLRWERFSSGPTETLSASRCGQAEVLNA